MLNPLLGFSDSAHLGSGGERAFLTGAWVMLLPLVEGLALDG